MMQVSAAQRSHAQAKYFDWPGFIALTIGPAVALYQGIVAAFGAILIPFDDTTASLITIAVIIGCTIWRLPALRGAVVDPRVKRSVALLLTYALVVGASTLLVYLDPIERDPARMTQQFLATCPALLMFFVMVASPGPAPAIRAVRASMIVWALAAVVTPLTALTPFAIGEVQGDYAGSLGIRSFGVLGDAGTFVVSFLTVAFFASKRPVWFALALFALILSGSRMALVVGLAALALVVILGDAGREARRRGARALKAVAASFAVLAVALLLPMLFSAVAERVGARDTFERITVAELTTSDRLFSMMQAVEWIQLSPLYGHGFNSYYFFSFRGSIFGANISNASNQIVQTMMDGGIVALLALGLFFAQAVWPNKGEPLVDRHNDPFAIRPWLVAFLILNQTAVFILPVSQLTTLVFGLVGVTLYLSVTRRLSPAAGDDVAPIGRLQTR